MAQPTFEELLDQYIAAQGVDAVVTALVSKAGGADRAVELIGKPRIAVIKDKFAGKIRDNAVTLSVKNWLAVEALGTAPITSDSSPANIFDDILAEIEAAIQMKNEQQLLEGWALLWKAVKRG